MPSGRPKIKPEDLRLWGTNGLILEEDKPFTSQLFRAPTYPYLKVGRTSGRQPTHSPP